MSKFINYRNLDFKINEENFYASRIDLSVKASVSPILLSDGTLHWYDNYAPVGAVVGSLSCEFYLTGALPDYLCIMGNIDESPVSITFAGVSITGAYPSSISFSVEPFSPITISAEFDWYGDVNVEKFSQQAVKVRNSKEPPIYIANAHKSYMTTDEIFARRYYTDYVSGPTSGPSASGPEYEQYLIDDEIGYISNFSYNASCSRSPFYNVDDLLPFRVAKTDVKCEMGLSSNNLGKMMSIKGKEVYTNIYLKDFYGDCVSRFMVSGIMTDQNYKVSEGSYLLTDAKIMQQAGFRKVEI